MCIFRSKINSTIKIKIFIKWFIRIGFFNVSGFSVLGDLLSVVRVKRDMRPPLNETDLMARLNTVDEQSALSALMEHTLDRFISSHILRITLPSGITAALKGKARSLSGNTLDINLSRAIGEGMIDTSKHIYFFFFIIYIFL